MQENTQLRYRLDQSLAGLNETQQLCLQLQEETEREREFIERWNISNNSQRYLSACSVLNEVEMQSKTDNYDKNYDNMAQDMWRLHTESFLRMWICG